MKKRKCLMKKTFKMLEFSFINLIVSHLKIIIASIFLYEDIRLKIFQKICQLA